MDDDLDGMTDEERQKALTAMRKFAEEAMAEDQAIGDAGFGYALTDDAFGHCVTDMMFGDDRTDQAKDAPLAEAVRGLSAMDLIDRRFKR